MDEKIEQKALKRIQLTLALTGKSIIPFKGGRPIRPEGNKCISHDDIINLLILLNTCKNFEEFLYLC